MSFTEKESHSIFQFTVLECNVFQKKSKAWRLSEKYVPIVKANVKSCNYNCQYALISDGMQQ